MPSPNLGLIHVAAAQNQKEVTINDAPVPFDDPDGWGLQDPETLVLQGSSCAEIQEGVVNIRLRCPCES